MAATSLAARASVGRDAIPPAPRRFSVQRNGQFRPVRRCAKDAVAHPVQIVADASAVQVVARSDAGRCPALCRELGPGCRWASGGKELVCVLEHQELQPLGALPQVACRAGLDVPLVALHRRLDALLPVARQERQAGAGALALAPPQAREQPQVLPASRPQDLAPMQALLEPLAAQQAGRGPEQSAPQELLSAQQEPSLDGLRAHATQARVPQARRRRAQRVSAELGLPHANRAAFAPPWPPLLSRRARQRLRLRHRQYPSNDGGPFPQLRR